MIKLYIGVSLLYLFFMVKKKMAQIRIGFFYIIASTITPSRKHFQTQNQVRAEIYIYILSAFLAKDAELFWAENGSPFLL